MDDRFELLGALDEIPSPPASRKTAWRRPWSEYLLLAGGPLLGAVVGAVVGGSRHRVAAAALGVVVGGTVGAAGCAAGEGEGLVAVTVTAEPPISGVVRIAGEVTMGSRTGDFEVDLEKGDGGAIAIPPERRFGLDLPTSFGDAAEVRLRAFGAGGEVLGHGRGYASVAAGRRSDTMLTLEEGDFAAAGVDGGPTCVSSLAGVGKGDFEIRFDITATTYAGYRPLLNQRLVCEDLSKPFWAIGIPPDGTILVHTNGRILTRLYGTRKVDDGMPHTIIVSRSGGILSITIDGQVDVEAFEAADLDDTLPSLEIGKGNYCYVNVSPDVSISNVCITR